MSSPEPVRSDQTVSAEGWSCLGILVVVLASLVIGVVTQELALAVLANAWSYCFDMAWPVTFDLADSPRFGIFQIAGYVLLYAACLPFGLLLARRVLRGRNGLVRLGAGVVAGLVLLLVVFAGDLMLHVSAPYPAVWDGPPPPSRCAAGRPPWWPSWLPARAPAHDLPRTR